MSKIKIQSKSGEEFEIETEDYPHLRFCTDKMYSNRMTIYEKEDLLVELLKDYHDCKISAESAMQALSLIILPQTEPTKSDIEHAKSLSKEMGEKYGNVLSSFEVPFVPTEGGYCKPISSEEAFEFFKKC